MSLPDCVPPIPRASTPNQNLPPEAAKAWLKAGWRDFLDVNLEASLLYGIVVFLLSVVIIGGLIYIGADYVLLPALAGFMVIGPALAVGLYEKSRRIVADEPVSIGVMLYVKAKSPGQILFVGVLLSLLILLWMRAAVLLYALFFGMHGFPGFDQIAGLLFTTPRGWGLLLVGSAFGALFAAFSFAISAFSIPILLNERSDAFSAMGASIVLVWNNLPVMISWGAIVLALFIASLLTGLLGLVVAFPVLGHATWHAYRAIRSKPGEPVLLPAIPSEMPQNPAST